MGKRLKEQTHPFVTDVPTDKSHDVSFELLKVTIIELLSNSSEVHLPTHEAGQIISALRRHATPDGSHRGVKMLPNDMAIQILQTTDYSKLNIKNIREVRLKMLQEALKRLNIRRK